MAFGPTQAAAVCGDSVVDSGEECEAPFGACCDEATCLYKRATTVCRAGSGDMCDLDELCTGTSDACPDDVFEPATTLCRAASGDPHGAGFVCNPDEFCTGNAGEACPADVRYTAAEGVRVSGTKDTRIMETHRSSNNGAAALVWLKRSPNVRGIFGWDLTCQGEAMNTVDCGTLKTSIYDGIPKLQGSTFAAVKLNAEWKEGNQAFDDFRWKGKKLGPFPGTGEGTTWSCLVDRDLADGGTHNCEEPDRWWGGDSCQGELCYGTPGAVAPFTSSEQEKLTWDITNDVIGHPAPISWILKVTDEEEITSGAVKIFQRDGARFIAESDPETTASEAFELAPRLILYGQDLVVPEITLVEPVSRSAAGNEIIVAVDQSGSIGGDPARWENKTLGTWGYMKPGLLEDWEATIPLEQGPNEVEFTVYDSCNTEAQATYTLSQTTGEFCGNGIVDPGEQCDDGNGITGDCCSGTCQIETDGSVCDDEDACTSTSTCSAGMCMGSGRAPAACGNSYMCYKAGVTRGTPAFTAVPEFSLDDAFGPNLVEVRAPQLLCAPAAVDGEPIVSAEAHRVSYKIKESTTRALPPGTRVTDRFGTITVDPQKAVKLLSPAGYRLDAPATPLGTGIADDHECYLVKLSIGKFPKGITFDAADSLEDRNYTVVKPLHLCLAADSNGSEISNPDAHLMCYRVRRSSGEEFHTKVKKRIHTADDIGPLELDTRSESELCVPATIAP